MKPYFTAELREQIFFFIVDDIFSFMISGLIGS